MGGYSSGRWSGHNAKSTTEGQTRIDIRWLKRQRCIIPGKSGSLTWSREGKQTASIGYRVGQGYMKLVYRVSLHGGKWEDIEQVINFDRTPCNYGGYRLWFLCSHCSKRVAVIYIAGKYFLCRHCHNLAYDSQYAKGAGQYLKKARKIFAKLGGKGNLVGYLPEKPKGMHWKTYWRLSRELLQAQTLANERANHAIEILKARLEKMGLSISYS